MSIVWDYFNLKLGADGIPDEAHERREAGKLFIHSSARLSMDCIPLCVREHYELVSDGEFLAFVCFGYKQNAICNDVLQPVATD